MNTLECSANVDVAKILPEHRSRRFEHAAVQSFLLDVDQQLYPKKDPAENALAIEFTPGMSVLEIGCGIGNTLYDVTERFHTHSVGIDLDAGLASRLPEQGSLTFEDCDIRELPEKFYNCFDAAFSYYTWHYIDDKLGALKNVHRALKIGGRALIDFGSLEVEDLGFQTRLYDPLMTPSLEEVINATDHRGQLSWERVNIFDVQGKQERRCCRVKIEKASDASIEFPSFEGIGSNLPGVKSAFKRSIYAG